MHRCVFAPVLVLLLAGPAAAQVQRPPAFDPERIFKFGDADLDGRLSLDEFRELYRSSPRMKNGAATIEPLFRRLDTDRDGFLSLAEYRKLFSQVPSSRASPLGRPMISATRRSKTRCTCMIYTSPSCTCSGSIMSA